MNISAFMHMFNFHYDLDAQSYFCQLFFSMKLTLQLSVHWLIKFCGSLTMRLPLTLMGELHFFSEVASANKQTSMDAQRDN